jgi:exosortase
VEWTPGKEDAPGLLSRFELVLLAGSVLVVLPARLLLEATPGWRSVVWVLALATVVITRVFMQCALGRDWSRHLAFPVGFILVAVPWLQSVELPLIQGLTKANVATTIEFAAILGIPAAQHGNVIEISRGLVGINEACSGIRSFQSSIMVALFLGELYRFRLAPRLGFCIAGVVLAFVYNAVRTFFLVWVASRNGVDAISKYHDQAGFTILLACTFSLWAVAWLMEKRFSGYPSTASGRTLNQERGVMVEPALPMLREVLSRRLPRLGPLAAALVVWLIAVEAGVAAWYRFHESGTVEGPVWHLKWPPPAADFQEAPIPEQTRKLLQCDEGHFGRWTTAGTVAWQMYYFKWLPGGIAVSEVRAHNPSVCMAASGRELKPIGDNRRRLQVGGVSFPFRRYEFEQNGTTLYVFHCLWENRTPGAYFDDDANLHTAVGYLSAVRQGKRNLGQRSIEIAVTGVPAGTDVETMVKAQLEQLIQMAPETGSVTQQATNRAVITGTIPTP